MPKVLLIIPPCFTNPEVDFEVGFPSNLCLLGTQVRAAGWDVLYLDMTLEEKEGYDSYAKLERQLSEREIKLVGISNHTIRTSITTRKVAAQVKRLRPDIKIVVGGVNATFMWRELLEECPAIDYVLRGYAQAGLRSLLGSSLEPGAGAVPGLVSRQGGVLRSEPLSAITPEDFATPNLEGLEAARYLDWTQTYPLLTHTGCGFACNFCTSVMPGPYQNREVYRPVEQVTSEMQGALAQGFERFFMTANVFTSNRAYCLELCRALKNDPTFDGVAWVCMTRVEFVDEELLLAMREAGCENIAFGVETAGKSQWQSLRKGRFSEKTVFDAFRLAAQAGIGTTAYLMLGAPEQTPADVEATIDLVRALNPNYRVVSFFQPFPGTSYWTSPELFGLTDIAPLEDWNFHEAPICNTRHLDKQALSDAAARLYMECANQPRLDPESATLEVAASLADAYPEMPSSARDAFTAIDDSISVKELLAQVKERHGNRGRLIALYWLSAALRDGSLRVAGHKGFLRRENAPVGA